MGQFCPRSLSRRIGERDLLSDEDRSSPSLTRDRRAGDGHVRMLRLRYAFSTSHSFNGESDAIQTHQRFDAGFTRRCFSSRGKRGGISHRTAGRRIDAQSIGDRNRLARRRTPWPMAGGKTSRPRRRALSNRGGGGGFRWRRTRADRLDSLSHRLCGRPSNPAVGTAGRARF